MRVQAVLVQCSGELLHGPWPRVTGVQLIPPLSQTRISGHLSHNQSVLAITHLPSREDPSSLPPQGQSTGMCSSAVILQLESAIGARPKSSHDPWNFLLQAATEVLRPFSSSPLRVRLSPSAFRRRRISQDIIAVPWIDV